MSTAASLGKVKVKVVDGVPYVIGPPAADGQPQLRPLSDFMPPQAVAALLSQSAAPSSQSPALATSAADKSRSSVLVEPVPMTSQPGPTVVVPTAPIPTTWLPHREESTFPVEYTPSNGLSDPLINPGFTTWKSGDGVVRRRPVAQGESSTHGPSAAHVSPSTRRRLEIVEPAVASPPTSSRPRPPWGSGPGRQMLRSPARLSQHQRQSTERRIQSLATTSPPAHGRGFAPTLTALNVNVGSSERGRGEFSDSAASRSGSLPPSTTKSLFDSSVKYNEFVSALPPWSMPEHDVPEVPGLSLAPSISSPSAVFPLTYVPVTDPKQAAVLKRAFAACEGDASPSADDFSSAPGALGLPVTFPALFHAVLSSIWDKTNIGKPFVLPPHIASLLAEAVSGESPREDASKLAGGAAAVGVVIVGSSAGGALPSSPRLASPPGVGAAPVSPSVTVNHGSYGAGRKTSVDAAVQTPFSVVAATQTDGSLMGAALPSDTVVPSLRTLTARSPGALSSVVKSPGAGSAALPAPAGGASVSSPTTPTLGVSSPYSVGSGEGSNPVVGGAVPLVDRVRSLIASRSTASLKAAAVAAPAPFRAQPSSQSFMSPTLPPLNAFAPSTSAQPPPAKQPLFPDPVDTFPPRAAPPSGTASLASSASALSQGALAPGTRAFAPHRYAELFSVYDAVKSLSPHGVA